MNTSLKSPSRTASTKDLIAEHSHKELLRFITCGSVDDGKSSLIGRLLLESGAVYEDQIAALKADSAKHGTAGDDLDPALLLDGLEDERQQGITIDVAYRYFATSKRKFIIADTPGHEQFTRNMTTGASTADLAVILVDAGKGLLTQTRRHAFIVSLLGIKHVILAVNKMDLVDYREDVFRQIVSDFQAFARHLDLIDLRCVPLSARNGDNVARPSSNTPWYAEGSLLHLLETIYFGSDHNLRDLRFPVQWVNRPDSGFRGFSGTVASGTIRAGDEIVVLPSKKAGRVRSIETFDGPLPEANAQQSVTLVLDTEIDIARGDMIARPGNLPTVSRQSDAMLVWMSEMPLVPGKSCWIKHTTRRTSCEVANVRYGLDVNTLHRLNCSTLQLNEIGRVRIATHDPLVYDAYQRNRQTGSFILVDRITHETIAAGMFLDAARDNQPGSHWETESDVPFQMAPVTSLISDEQRCAVYGHLPRTLLISGLSGAGKTTVAKALEKRLFDLGMKTVLLDGQMMRSGISRDLGFSAEERSENLRRAASIARLINDAGLICIASFMAPHDQVREKVKTLIGANRLLHVHLSTPIDVCRRRDLTGIYDAADRGEVKSLPGAGSHYEEPADADLVISTEFLATDEIVSEIIKMF
jgi:bifunctional enzyme CysN/CysC